MKQQQLSLRSILLCMVPVGLALCVMRVTLAMSLPFLVALFIVCAISGGLVGYSVFGRRGAVLGAAAAGAAGIALLIGVFLALRT